MITTILIAVIIGDIAATAAQCHLNLKMMKDIQALKDKVKDVK
jgi:hypothetical protein